MYFKFFKLKKDELGNYKLAFIFTIITLFFIGYLIHKFVPNELDTDFILKTYSLGIENFVAEQSEKFQYIILTIGFPILFILFSKLTEKFNFAIKENCMWILLFLLLFYVCKVQKFYEAYSIISLNIVLYICTSIFIIYILKDYNKYRYKRDKRAFNAFLTITPIVVILILSILSVNNMYMHSTFEIHHVNAYYYPISKINSGLTPGVDFNCIYGFYGYFFSIIIKLLSFTGIESIKIFALIISILIFLIYIFIYIFILRVIKNRIISFLTFFAVLFSGLIYNIILSNGDYLQYTPHRMFFPSIYLFLISIYFNKNNDEKKKFNLIIYGILSLGVLWNIETGIVVLFTHFLLNIYEILLEYQINDKKTYVKISHNVVYVILSLFLSLLILESITFIRTGHIINIIDLFSSQIVFYGSGFYMLKMNLFDFWLILVSVYCIALFKSLKKLKFMKFKDNYPDDEKYMTYFILSILGMGIFSYYQGRSHASILPLVIYPAVIVLGIFLEQLYLINIKEYIIKIKRTCLLLLLLSISLSGFYFLLPNSPLWEFYDKNSTPLERFLKL